MRKVYMTSATITTTTTTCTATVTTVSVKGKLIDFSIAHRTFPGHIWKPC